MNTYENIIIFNAALSDEDLKAAKDRIYKLITGAEGRILKEDPWGLKRLAYEINKHKKGYYLRLIFSSPSTVVRTLEDFYKVFDPVIKYMFIRLEKPQLKALEKELRADEASASTKAEGDKEAAGTEAEVTAEAAAAASESAEPATAQETENV